MLFNHNNQFMTALIIMAVMMFFSFAGCSKAPTQIAQEEEVVLLQRNLSAMKVTGISAYLDTVLSAEKGGVVTLLDVELYFPPKALDNDALISISIPDLAIFANDFGTNGLEFNEPVRVIMSYRDAALDNIDESSIKMAWFDERKGTWDVIDCQLDTIDKTVTAHVNHFSAYALISD